MVSDDDFFIPKESDTWPGFANFRDFLVFFEIQAFVWKYESYVGRYLKRDQTRSSLGLPFEDSTSSRAETWLTVYRPHEVETERITHRKDEHEWRTESRTLNSAVFLENSIFLKTVNLFFLPLVPQSTSAINTEMTRRAFSALRVIRIEGKITSIMLQNFW